jgi:DNA helicase HerA-like ATPase
MDSPHTIIGSQDNAVVLTALHRRRHMAIIGATGSGKTSLLLHIFAQDAERGDGVLYIDPLGDDAERALDLIPEHRRNQVCYFNVADRDHPVAMNILEDVAPDDRERLADNIVSAMRGIWADLGWGARMEQILRHSLVALIETRNASLVLLPRLLTDDAFRKRITARISNPVSRNFFQNRFEQWRRVSRGSDRPGAKQG